MTALRFVSHPGIFNRMCIFAQYGFPYTHVEADMEDGCFLGAMRDGVKARPKGWDAGKVVCETSIDAKMTSEQKDRFFGFLRNQIGKPYDFKAVTAFFFARDWQEPDHWDCSELIASALATCGLFPKHLAVQFDRITVRDVFLLVSTLTEVDNGAGA